MICSKPQDEYTDRDEPFLPAESRGTSHTTAEISYYIANRQWPSKKQLRSWRYGKCDVCGFNVDRLGHDRRCRVQPTRPGPTRAEVKAANQRRADLRLRLLLYVVAPATLTLVCFGIVPCFRFGWALLRAAGRLLG